MELSVRQFGAIRKKIKKGKYLRDRYPYIANLYRSGMFASTICNELHEKEGEVDIVANDVHSALIGHKGGFGISSYSGLLEEEEIEGLRKKHNEMNGSKNGKKSRNDGTGIFGRSLEQRVNDAGEAGKKGGKKVYEEGLGVHNLTSEQHSNNGRKGAITQGKILIIRAGDRMHDGSICLVDEDKFAYEQSLIILCMGTNKGRSNYQLITPEVNKEYHDRQPIRTVESIRNMVRGYKKRNKL